MSNFFERLANKSIEHLKKSPVLQKTATLADGAMDELNKQFHIEAISLDKLAAGLSADTDKLILDTQRNEGLSFVGGELIASSQATQAAHFSLRLQLYFQNSQNKVILKAQNKELALSILDEISQQDLQQKQSISYEVNAPT